jgi:plasmid stabilization system protein ParE
MAVKPLDIHPAALQEAKLAVSWYLDRSETAAVRFHAELNEAIDLIIQSPDRWPSGDHSTRRFVLKHFPFAVIYREKDMVVEVLAIAHGHRSPSYWEDRL